MGRLVGSSGCGGENEGGSPTQPTAKAREGTAATPGVALLWALSTRNDPLPRGQGASWVSCRVDAHHRDIGRKGSHKPEVPDTGLLPTRQRTQLFTAAGMDDSAETTILADPHTNAAQTLTALVMSAVKLVNPLFLSPWMPASHVQQGCELPLRGCMNPMKRFERW